MEDFLGSVKSLANSLAAIRAPILDMDLIQYTPNGLGSKYDTIVDTPTYMINLCFDIF